MVNFISNPPVPEHEIHGEYNLPVRYRKETNTIHYSMTGPMIDSVNDDVDISIKVSEYPDDALLYLYRSISKTNNQILKDNGKERWEGLSTRLESEIKDRGIHVPNTELTHEVTMNKKQATNVPLEKVPVIIKIGSVPEDEDYDFGTTYEDMMWKVLTTEEEAKYIQDNFNNIIVNKNNDNVNQ